MTKNERDIEGSLKGVGGVSLSWRGWLPPFQPTGLVMIAHGAHDHSGRFARLARDLGSDGWAVYCLDTRGHGRSGGPRVHVDRFSDFLDDFGAFHLEVGSRHPGLPHFLLGQGMGAQITLAYALADQDAIRGLVLSAPLLSAPSVSKATQAVGRLAARLRPNTRMSFIDPADKISKDPYVLDSYRNDQLVNHGPPTLSYAAIGSAQFRPLLEGARRLRIPMLVQHGTLDAISAPEGTNLLESESGSPDQTVFWYRGFWHEIYNEPEYEKPVSDLRNWLAERR